MASDDVTWVLAPQWPMCWGRPQLPKLRCAGCTLALDYPPPRVSPGETHQQRYNTSVTEHSPWHRHNTIVNQYQHHIAINRLKQRCHHSMETPPMSITILLLLPIANHSIIIHVIQMYHHNNYHNVYPDCSQLVR